MLNLQDLIKNAASQTAQATQQGIKAEIDSAFSKLAEQQQTYERQTDSRFKDLGAKYSKEMQELRAEVKEMKEMVSKASAAGSSSSLCWQGEHVVLCFFQCFF